MSHVARLTNSFMGEWELYVVTDAPTRDWPFHEFGRTGPVPTLAERTAALTALGYESAQAGEWAWTESQNTFAERVELTASLTVRTVTAKAAP
ncbi:DUF6303 family protein [Streptomyces sp. NPDC093801]|uniref:DUF6303 family protein n=1 Tax=Streptomyces sp. NPDC093801 TaxID=3155203 RepID=UPI00344FE92E